MAKPARKKATPKRKGKAVKVKVPTRELSVERRRGGKVKVVVQTKLAIAALAKPLAAAVRPRRFEGAALEVSRQFFLAHRLTQLAEALPASAAVDDLLAQGQADGLKRAFVFPPVAAQRLHAEAMVMQLLKAASPALEPSQQYSLPWLFDLAEISQSEIRGRPEGCYGLAISPGAFPDDTRNRKAAQLETRFAALGYGSLTAFEYMVFQRLFAEENQDHRFDQMAEAHGHPTGWQWLLDSKSTRGALHAGWNPARRRVEIGTAPTSSFSTSRGAHATLVKPL